MKNMPSIKEMMNTFRIVFRDIFLGCIANSVDTMEDGTKLENALTATIYDFNLKIYVSFCEYHIDLIVWNNTIHKIKKRLKYSYCDFAVYESIIAQMIVDIYDTCRALQYE